MKRDTGEAREQEAKQGKRRRAGETKTVAAEEEDGFRRMDAEVRSSDNSAMPVSGLKEWREGREERRQNVLSTPVDARVGLPSGWVERDGCVPPRWKW